MSVTARIVEVTAVKGHVLTLGDLREFIGALDAAGAADTTPVAGRTNWRGHQQSLRAVAVRFGDKQ